MQHTRKNKGLNLFEKCILNWADLDSTDSVLTLSRGRQDFFRHLRMRAERVCFSNQSFLLRLNRRFDLCLSAKPLCFMQNFREALALAKCNLQKGKLLLVSYCAPKFLVNLLNSFCKDSKGQPFKKFYSKKELEALMRAEGFLDVRCSVEYGFIAVCTGWSC